MTQPAAADQIHLLLHFGWACAELRGRYRQQLTNLPMAPAARDRRTDYTLPLNRERSPGELLRQTLQEAERLATALGYNVPVSDLPHQTPSNATAADQTVPSTAVLDHAQTLFTAGMSGPAEGRHAAWTSIANLFYQWDTTIQDALIGSSPGEAAAYQLGRGLAETYWEMTPSAPDGDVRSWTSLLGSTRRTLLRGFVVQLSDHLDARTVVAVRASIDAWGSVAANAKLRAKAESVSALYDQVSVWHALLVDGVAPTSFIELHSVLHYARRSVPILRAVWPELLAALASGGLGLGAVVALTDFKANTLVVGFVAVLGLFGITAAGLVARARTAATASVSRMVSVLEGALVADAVTVPPAKITSR
jgi:hypothetical protein